MWKDTLKAGCCCCFCGTCRGPPKTDRGFPVALLPLKTTGKGVPPKERQTRTFYVPSMICPKHRCPSWLIGSKNRGRFLVYLVVQSTRALAIFPTKDTCPVKFHVNWWERASVFPAPQGSMNRSPISKSCHARVGLVTFPSKGINGVGPVGCFLYGCGSKNRNSKMEPW